MEASWAIEKHQITRLRQNVEQDTWQHLVPENLSIPWVFVQWPINFKGQGRNHWIPKNSKMPSWGTPHDTSLWRPGFRIKFLSAASSYSPLLQTGKITSQSYSKATSKSRSHSISWGFLGHRNMVTKSFQGTSATTADCGFAPWSPGAPKQSPPGHAVRCRLAECTWPQNNAWNQFNPIYKFNWKKKRPIQSSPKSLHQENETIPKCLPPSPFAASCRTPAGKLSLATLQYFQWIHPLGSWMRPVSSSDFLSFTGHSPKIWMNIILGYLYEKRRSKKW